MEKNFEIISDGLIRLIKKEKKEGCKYVLAPNYKYLITLQSEHIGFINIRIGTAEKYEDISKSGNIYVVIYPQHRGNKYSYYVIHYLYPLLDAHGLKYIDFVCERSNGSAINIIKKFDNIEQMMHKNIKYRWNFKKNK